MAFDLDSAARELREEPTPAPRVLPSRRRARPLRWVAPLAAGIAVFVLWPRAESGTAWGQVAAVARREERIVIRSETPGRGGRMESYRDGARFALDFYDKGKLLCRIRNDGERSMQCLGPSKIAWVVRVNPSDPSQFSTSFYGRFDSLNEMLNNRDVREFAPSATKDGLIRYSLEWRPKRTTHSRFYAYAEPGTLRLCRLENLKGTHVASTQEISYPDAIPASRFAPEPPPGAVLRDGDRALEVARAQIRKGVATQTVRGRRITLRALIKDPDAFEILWTGTDIPTMGPFWPTLDAAPLRIGYGIEALSSKPEKDARYRPAVYGGLPVRGQGYWIHDLGKSRYTVRIPIVVKDRKVGEAVFKNVQILDIPSVYAVGPALLIPKIGMRKP